MSEPLTKLDARFSDPGANATPWAAAREVLETAQLSWVTTVRADGRPHVTPLVAVWLDDAVYFTTGSDEQKAVNLAANPHVVLITGCNGWDEGLDVIVEGEARAADARRNDRSRRAGPVPASQRFGRLGTCSHIAGPDITLLIPALVVEAFRGAAGREVGEEGDSTAQTHRLGLARGRSRALPLIRPLRSGVLPATET
jgi:hypothetical protein